MRGYRCRHRPFRAPAVRQTMQELFRRLAAAAARRSAPPIGKDRERQHIGAHSRSGIGRTPSARPSERPAPPARTTHGTLPSPRRRHSGERTLGMSRDGRCQFEHLWLHGAGFSVFHRGPEVISRCAFVDFVGRIPEKALTPYRWVGPPSISILAHRARGTEPRRTCCKHAFR